MTDQICLLPAPPHSLTEHGDTSIVLGLATGLVRVDAGQLKEVLSDPLDWAARGPDGQYYGVRPGEILRINADSGAVEDVTSLFAGTPADADGIWCSPTGEIWVGGCATRRLVDGSFEPVPPSPAGNVTPTPRTLDIHGNYWSLVAAGDAVQVVVLPANAPAAWQPAWLPVGAWNHLLADHVGHVWVAGADGLRLFIPRHTDRGWLVVPDDVLPGEVTALAVSPDELVMAACSTGEIIELDTRADGQVKVRPLLRLPEPAVVLYTTRDGAIWAATETALYRQPPAATAWQRTWEKKRGRLPGGGNHDVFSVPCQGKLYVPGGWAGEWGLPPVLHVMEDLFAYDAATEYWEIAARMILPRRYCGIATIQGCVWVVGGETRIPGWDGEGQVLYTVDVFDPATTTWRPAPSLNIARTDPFVVNHGGRIWAIGGAAHNSGPKLDSVESIGPGEDTWRMEAPLPEPTRQGHGCVLDDIIYCASIDGMYAYDVTTGRWDDAFPQPGPIGQGPLAASYEGEVWLMGGHGDRSIRCYNPTTRTWRQGPDLPTEQAWAAAAVMDGQLIIVGGAHGSPQHEATIFDDRTYVLRRDT